MAAATAQPHASDHQALANNAISSSSAIASSSKNLVADHLKSPDDLSRLEGLRSKLHRESLTLEAKLKSGAKEQLEAIRDGLLKLQATRKDVQGVREAFAEVERICTRQDGVNEGNGSASSQAFRVISQVSQIHRNFVQTSNVLHSLEMLPPKIEHLSRVLDEAQADLYGEASDLLWLHHHISALEAFRNETLQMARTCSADVRAHLSHFFEPLDGLVRSFDEYLLALGSRTFDLVVREGRASVVVRLIKIIEKESRQDEKAAAIRLAKKANLEGAARFRSVIANARVIKLYRPKLLEAIDAATGDLFEECWQRFGSEGREIEFLDHLDWVYKDLDMVKEQIVGLFPPDYNILRFFAKSYHKHLGQTLRARILDLDPPASTVLSLYQFTQEYTSTMRKDLGIPVDEWLQPTLLDGREQSIIDDYLGLITRKIDEWTANLMSDEVRLFTQRNEAPERDAEGLYGLNYASILFQMLTQQCDLAADSNQGSLVARCVGHATRAIMSSQATWLRVLEAEFSKQVKAKNPEDVPPGLTEYVIALCNELIKSADLAEALGKRFESLVSTKYKATIREDVDNAVNGYLDVSARCGGILVQFVFEDLRPAVKDLFTLPAWYMSEGGGTCTVIVETMRDYLSDYAELLNPNFFEARLLPDLVDRFLVSYLGALRKVGSGKLKMPAAAERMREDVREFRTMMMGVWIRDAPAESGEGGSGWSEKAGGDLLDGVLSLLSSSPAMVFLPYWSFAKQAGPNLAFFEALLRARDDVDKSDVSAIMESARRKVKAEELPDLPRKDEGAGEGSGEPTHAAAIMKRVEAAYAAGTGVGAAGALWSRGAQMIGSSSSAVQVGEGLAGGAGPAATGQQAGWGGLAGVVRRAGGMGP